MLFKKITASIIEDGRVDAQCVSHQKVRFVLSRSSDERILGLWMGLDNMVSMRPVNSNLALLEKDKQAFEKSGASLLKKKGIKNVRFVWISPT